MSKQETGAKSAVRMQPLAIYEYTDLSRIPRMIGDSPDDALPTLKNALHSPVVDSKLLRLVDKKWVYHFVRQKGKAVIKTEAYITLDAQGNQTAQHVDWSSGIRYPDETRGLKYEKSSALSIDLAQPCWLILSQEQISTYRLNWYRENPDILELRGQSISTADIPQAANGTARLSAYLVDPLLICEGLHNTYRKSLETYSENENNPDAELKRAFYGTVYSVANVEPRVKRDWLDWPKFKADADKLKKYDFQCTQSLAIAEAWLFSWKITPFFRLAWEDLSGYPEIEKKALDKVAKLTSNTELRFLTWEISQKDSWYAAVMNGPELKSNRFQFGRKLATAVLDGKLADFVDQWIIGRSLAVIAASGMNRNARTRALESLATEIEDLIIRRNWASHVPELNPDRRTPDGQRMRRFLRGMSDLNGVAIGHHFSTFYQGIHFSNSAHQPEIRTASQRNGFLDSMRKKREALAKLSKVGSSIFLGLEAVNLYYAVNQLRDSNPEELAKNSVNAVGSICDLTGSVQFLAETNIGQRGLAKLGMQAVGKVFLRIAFVGSFTDLIGAGYGVFDAYSKGKNATLAGNLVVASSAIIGMVSAVGSILALGGAATGLAAVAGPLGWIALGLFITGNLIILAFTESDLETWCRDSRWGNSTLLRSSKYDPTQGMKKELRSLMKVLSALRPRCYINPIRGQLNMGQNGNYYSYTYQIVVEIGLGPIFNQEASKIHFNLEVLRDRLVTSSVIGSKRGVLLEPNIGRIEIKDGRALSWSVGFPATELGIHGSPEGRAFDFRISNLYLNLNGDDAPENIYPDKTGYDISDDLELKKH